MLRRREIWLIRHHNVTGRPPVQQRERILTILHTIIHALGTRSSHFVNLVEFDSPNNFPVFQVEKTRTVAMKRGRSTKRVQKQLPFGDMASRAFVSLFKT